MLRNIQAEGRKFVFVKTFAIFANLVHLVLNEARSYGILIRCLKGVLCLPLVTIT